MEEVEVEEVEEEEDVVEEVRGGGERRRWRRWRTHLLALHPLCLQLVLELAGEWGKVNIGTRNGRLGEKWEAQTTEEGNENI